MKKPKITIGIPAYNEEKNIEKILSCFIKDSPKNFDVAEIIVVSDGSNDFTVNNVLSLKRRLGKKGRIIKLVHYKKRQGKWYAINQMLRACTTKIIVMSSADLIPEEGCIDLICTPLMNEDIGICGARPLPTNSSKTLIGFAVNMIWKLHHKISEENPKFGEMIAFKKVFTALPKTIVDEEYIASLVMNKGLKGEYVKGAIVRNHGPETFADFIKQRRRIYCGHLQLSRISGRIVPTLNNKNVIKAILRSYSPNEYPKVISSIALEAYARALGWLDYKKKKFSYAWEIAESTKNIREAQK